MLFSRRRARHDAESKMSHHLVTGAAGFIASKVIKFLLDEGYTVVGIDNLNDTYSYASLVG